MLNIKNAGADELARRLSALTGMSITAVITQALREQLRRLKGRTAKPALAEDLLEIGRRCAALPDLDSRSADEIPGYNESGAWS